MNLHDEHIFIIINDCCAEKRMKKRSTSGEFRPMDNIQFRSDMRRRENILSIEKYKMMPCIMDGHKCKADTTRTLLIETNDKFSCAFFLSSLLLLFTFLCPSFLHCDEKVLNCCDEP